MTTLIKDDLNDRLRQIINRVGHYNRKDYTILSIFFRGRLSYSKDHHNPTFNNKRCFNGNTFY